MLLRVFPRESLELARIRQYRKQKTYASTILPSGQPKDIFYHELIHQHLSPVDQPLLVILGPGV